MIDEERIERRYFWLHIAMSAVGVAVLTWYVWRLAG